MPLVAFLPLHRRLASGYHETMEPPAIHNAALPGEAEIIPVITEKIGVRPGYCDGEPHILGHRIKVRHVAVWHDQQGMSAAEIVATYPSLTLAQVHAALAYYYDHRDEILAAIAEENDFAEKLKSALGPSLMQKKLGQRNAADDSVPSLLLL
jgi:uncharacterized protein (DUF433 family)